MLQDYDQFDMANEIDELDIFLKLASAKKDNAEKPNDTEVTPKLDNGVTEQEDVEEKETVDNNGTMEPEEVAADVAA